MPLDGAGFEGAWVRDLARDTQESEALMRTTLSRLAQRGELHQVVKDLFYPPHTIHRLAAIARGLGASGDVTAAAFRDATQLGRKRAIQVLDHGLERAAVLAPQSAQRMQTLVQLGQAFGIGLDAARVATQLARGLF